MAILTYSCDFEHPYIRVEWQHKKTGSNSWLPVDAVFGDAVDDQAGNTINIDTDLLTFPIDDAYGHVRAMAYTLSGKTVVTKEAALSPSSTLDVWVEPDELVILSSGIPDPAFRWDFATQGWADVHGQFVRGSAATVYDSISNTMEHLAVNQPGIIPSLGLQLEDTTKNFLVNNTDFSSWVDRGTLSLIESGRPSFDGGNNATHLRIAEQTTYDIGIVVATGLSVGDRLSLNAFVKKHPGTANNTLNLEALSSSNGDWDVDLASSPDDEWLQLKSDEPTVTVNDTFKVESGGDCSIQLFHTGAAPYLDADWFGLQLEPGEYRTSMVPTPTGAVAERAPSYAVIDIATLGLPSSGVMDTFSFQQSSLLLVHGDVQILCAVQDTPGYDEGFSILYIYLDGAGDLRCGGRGIGGWKEAPETFNTGLVPGYQDINLRGKSERVGDTVVVSLWINESGRQDFVIPIYWTVPMTYFALHNRNERFVSNGACKSYRISDELVHDAVIERWG